MVIKKRQYLLKVIKIITLVILLAVLTTPYSMAYEAHCWSCGAYINSNFCDRCEECGWYICDECGACEYNCDRTKMTGWEIFLIIVFIFFVGLWLSEASKPKANNSIAYNDREEAYVSNFYDEECNDVDFNNYLNLDRVEEKEINFYPLLKDEYNNYKNLLMKIDPNYEATIDTELYFAAWFGFGLVQVEGSTKSAEDFTKKFFEDLKERGNTGEVLEELERKFWTIYNKLEFYASALIAEKGIKENFIDELIITQTFDCIRKNGIEEEFSNVEEISNFYLDVLRKINSSLM